MDYFTSYAEAEEAPSDVASGTWSPLEEQHQKQQQQQQKQQQQQQQQQQQIALLPPLNSAPATIQGAELSIQQRKRGIARPEDLELTKNLKIDAVEAPIVGPLTPLQERLGGLRYVYGKRLGGEVERAHLSRIAFDEQYNQFMSAGHAADPSDGLPAVEVPLRTAEIIPALAPLGGSSSNNSNSSSSSSSSSKLSRKERKAQRPQRNEDVESDSFQGPWALYIHPAVAAAEAAAAAAAAAASPPSSAGEAAAASGEAVGPAADTATATKEEESAAADSKDFPSSAATAAATAIFHGKELRDYQGRSWLEPPSGLKPLGPDATFFPPRQQIHVFAGHSGGVQAIRLYPETAHLLLSASLDSTVKIWDIYNQRKCRCTYTPHKQAVRDVQWAGIGGGGERFISCGYDNWIFMNDTETGKVISSFTNKKTPYCLAVYPADSNIFIVGCSNKRAVQYDARSGDVVVEYTDHLGAVNTVSFCENGKRVATTADDKKLFIWEYGIPVVIKHIADPDMHSMPACCMHPTGRLISFQAMNNEIITYEAWGKFRFLPQRRFRGHLSAGYAIQPAFSPEGRYLASGDSTGKLFIWDFRNGRIIRTIKAHNKVCMGAQWHPHHTSRIFTCSWDGLIKLWD